MAAKTLAGSGIKRQAWNMLSAALVLLVAVSGFAALPGTRVAVAQERPRTVMDMLFGRDPPRRRYIEEPEPLRIIRKRPKAPKARAGVSAKAAGVAGASGPAAGSAGKPAVVAKSATAKTVLVVGDFMASSLAGGLEGAVAANPEVKVVSTADGSSGLVRDDHFDWVGKIGPLIDTHKPSVVVVMLGSNDRQPLTSPDGTLALRSDGWMTEYERRANAFAIGVKDKNVPLIWVGMPSFKSTGMSADMAFFNEIYRKAAGSAGGEFVDVWDGFVDAGGAFAASGPDIAGQQARLRSSNGITMTPKGSEKLAFFAQKPIFRILGTPATGSPIGLASGDPERAPGPAPTDAANATSTPPLGLTDPSLEGGETLLGGGAPPAGSAKPSPRERLVIAGSPIQSPAGRADEFRWSAKTPAVSPLRVGNSVVSRGRVDLKNLRSAQGIRPPAEMPTLADAIVNDWASQPPPAGGPSTSPAAPAAFQGSGPQQQAPKTAPPAQLGPTAAAASQPPVSASPFVEDQQLR